MENRIRKTDTVVPQGPMSAGVRVATDYAFWYNPDGTERLVGPVVVSQLIPAAADAVSKHVWIAPFKCQVIGVRAVFATASTSGTVTVEKLTGTTAAGSGTDLLSSTIALSGTANTVASGTLISTTASKKFAAGDRLGLKFGGTVTNLVNAVVTVYFKQV